MNYIEKFNYRITGKSAGPKLVFLHGLMGFASNWRSIAKAFEQYFEILCYDQRGHGKSFQPESGYGPEDYADDLSKILEELGWDKIVLVGHSMGSRNANHFAFKYPHKVIALVLEDLGPEANPDSILKNRALLNRFPTPFESKKVARAHVTEEFKDQPILGEYLYANLKEKEDGSVDWRFYRKGIEESVLKGRSIDRWSEFEALSVPTLLIRGESSDEFPAEIYESMLKRNTNVEGVVIPDAEHWVHFDQKELFIESLKKFFEKQGLI